MGRTHHIPRKSVSRFSRTYDRSANAHRYAQEALEDKLGGLCDRNQGQQCQCQQRCQHQDQTFHVYGALLTCSLPHWSVGTMTEVK